MDEILLLMLLLFVAYLFLPKSWLARFVARTGVETAGASGHLPEDSVLRRHFITELRNQIELELSPRPADALQLRDYESRVETELKNRLAVLSA